MRYSQRTIDDAALVGHVLAFNEGKFGNSSDDEPYAVARELGIPESRLTEVVELFSSAYIQVDPSEWGGFDDGIQARDAAAESLLRSGWLPATGAN